MKPKSRLMSSFRPRLQLLEDRVQPSVVSHPLADVAQATPLPATVTASPIHPLLVASAGQVQLDHHGDGSQAPAVDYGTYTTGTTHDATATAVTVDSSNNQYVVGKVVVDLMSGGTGVAGYVIKYLPNSTTIDPTFNMGQPVMYRPTFMIGGVPTPYDFDAHAVAVHKDPSFPYIEVAGDAVNPVNGNHLALIASFNQDGSRRAGAGYGASTTGTAPNSVEGAVTDQMGDVFLAGIYSFGGHPNLTTFIIPDGADASGSSGGFYDFGSPTAAYSIAIDSAPQFGYIAGYITQASTGSQKLGFAGQADFTAVGQPLGGFFFTDQGGGDIVFKGTDLNLGPNDATHGGIYFVGTAPQPMTSGVTDGLALRFYLDPTMMGAFTFDQNNSLAFSSGTAGNSLDFKAVAVDQATGLFYVVGDETDPTGASQVALIQLDALLATEQDVNLVGNGSDHGNGVAVRANGHVSIAATTTSSSGISTDGTTLMGNSDGALIGYTF
jgi:hypothetical protein